MAYNFFRLSSLLKINILFTLFNKFKGLGNSSLFEEFVRSHRRLSQPAEQFELAVCF